MVLSKKELRTKLRKKRNSLERDRVQELSQPIRERLLHLSHNFHRIMLFYPTDGEPDVRPLFDELISSGKELFLPKVVGERIQACRVENPSWLSGGRFGIPEPEPCVPSQPKDIDMVAVPGVAFDREGYRLGFGKGYYDRFLSQTEALKVGVLYSFQLVDFVPREPWDVPMDILITERETIHTQGGKSWKF